MAERKLGRGLDSLLGAPRTKRGEEVIQIPVTELRRSPFQPRQEMDEVRLQELAASIKESGVLQPILVRPSGTGYEIVAGERRFRAAEKAGLKEIPALIRPYSDEDVLVLSLVENVQRADLNPIDKAQAYQRLVKHLGATQADIAQKLGLNGATVSNMLRLLELPDEVKDLVRNRALTMGHARALLALPDDVEQLKMAERVIREGLSVRAVEEFARRGSGAQAATPPRRKNPRKTPQVAALEADLRAHLGTKVSIQDRRGKGRITIEYYSPDDFERIVQQIQRGGEQGYSIP